MSCTTILVGKKASNDGSTMVARTEDGHFDVKRLTVVNPKDQPKKYKTKISHLEIELTEKPMHQRGERRHDGYGDDHLQSAGAGGGSAG